MRGRSRATTKTTERRVARCEGEGTRSLPTRASLRCRCLLCNSGRGRSGRVKRSASREGEAAGREGASRSAGVNGRTGCVQAGQCDGVCVWRGMPVRRTGGSESGSKEKRETRSSSPRLFLLDQTQSRRTPALLAFRTSTPRRPTVTESESDTPPAFLSPNSRNSATETQGTGKREEALLRVVSSLRLHSRLLLFSGHSRAT